MGANPRTKGSSGEREVAKIMNAMVDNVRAAKGLPVLDVLDQPFQRNQNQSAVGGDDLTNPYRLSIEVKRQEQLSINGWWKQCVTSSERFGNLPILIFRQNQKKWRVMMWGNLPMQPHYATTYKALEHQRVEIDLDTFKAWGEMYLEGWIK